MQIKHLSGADLQRFGKILPSFPETGSTQIKKRLCLEPQAQVPCYESSSETVLDYVAGMSALVIYDNGQPTLFYLDRIVALQPGTRFSILPLADGCQVDVLTCEDMSCREYVPVTALENPNKGLQLEKIYTFLYQEFSPNFYFRGEKHRPYELVYVKRGALHNLVRGQDIELAQQSFMIIDSNDWHTQYSELSVNFLTVSFWASDSRISDITNRRFSSTPQITAIFEKMLQQNKQDPYSDDYIDALLKILLIELLENASTDSGFQRSARCLENEIVDKAVRIISENTAKKLTLEELATQVHTSVPYLYKLFQQHLGISPGKYITKIRIEECKVLLRDGHLPMGQIAERMGFSSLQHFSRQFKTICGISPSQYIRSIR